MVITEDFAQTYNDSRCSNGIQGAFQYMSDQKNNATFQKMVQTEFGTCANITSGDNITALYQLISNGFAYMAMTDYPMEASFLEPMPAYPINVSCKAFENTTASTANDTLVKNLKAAADVYFNYKGQQSCYNFGDTSGSGTLAAGGWDVLACNQLAMPTAPGGEESMFLYEPFNYTAFTADCQARFNLTPNYNWALDSFGGRDNYREEYKVYSNIIFSNGNLDPWKAGGVTSYVNYKLPVYVIQGGAHHLDLRLPDSSSDPSDLVWVRNQEDEIIG